MKIRRDSNSKVPPYSVMDRGKEVQSNLDARLPSFTKLMLQSHVKRGFWMGLPAEFCQKYLPSDDRIITLEDEDGEEYETKFLAVKRGLSGGWAGFVQAKKLLEGDVVVFHLVRSCKFKVYILRSNRFGEVDGAIGLLNLQNFAAGRDSATPSLLPPSSSQATCTSAVGGVRHPKENKGKRAKTENAQVGGLHSHSCFPTGPSFLSGYPATFYTREGKTVPHSASKLCPVLKLETDSKAKLVNDTMELLEESIWGKAKEFTRKCANLEARNHFNRSLLHARMFGMELVIRQKAAEESLEAVRSELEREKKANSSLTSQVKSLKTELLKVVQELENTKKDLSTKEEQLNKLQLEYRSCKDERSRLSKYESEKDQIHPDVVKEVISKYQSSSDFAKLVTGYLIPSVKAGVVMTVDETKRIQPDFPFPEEFLEDYYDPSVDEVVLPWEEGYVPPSPQAVEVNDNTNAAAAAAVALAKHASSIVTNAEK